MHAEELEWLNLPLHERRYITVTEDAEAAGGDGDLSRTALMAPIRVSLVSRTASAVASMFRKKVEEDGEDATILKLLPPQVGRLDFGHQGWEPGIVYAVNPRLSTMYRCLATFHEEMLIHKINELERLLNALGAKEYLITQTKKNDVSMATNLAMRLFDAGASSRRQKLEERTWSGTSDGHSPRMPSDLVWYDAEGEWSNLVESRFHGSRRRFAFTVKQDEDFGVDARLAASLQAAKLNIGGRYATTQNFEFSVTGTF